MKYIYKLSTATILALSSSVFFGCGSSSSSSTPTQTGTFIDAAVAGVEYETSSGLKGITDKEGHFQFRNGDSVTMKIGKLVLGTTKPKEDGLVTPVLLADNNASQVLILQTLQSLDSDGNTSNGIEIDPEVLENLSKNLEEEKHIADLNETELLEIDVTLKTKLDKNHDGKIDINASTAKAHYNESLDKYLKKQKEENQKKQQQQQKENENYADEHEINRSNQNEKGNQNNNSHNETQEKNLDLYTTTDNLSQDVKDSIAYMGNEERLAYDTYMTLYNYYSQDEELYVLYNIASKSESKHIQRVQDLVSRYDLNATALTNVDDNVTKPEVLPTGKYDIAHIQDLYDALIAKGEKSKQDALEVGCMVEVTDVNDLDEKIALAQKDNATDVISTFESLRNGSYNHYWAFDKALKNMGVSQGCCSLGEEYCKDYPKNEH